MSRLPIASSVAQSNGHGRAESGHMPTGRQGKSSSSPRPRLSRDAELRTMPPRRSEEAGQTLRPVLRVTSPPAPRSLHLRQLPAGLPGDPPGRLPRLRGRPPNQTNSPVRGVSIVGTPQAALNSILATGNKQEIFNGICGAESGSIPVSAVAPAMLVSQIETQRQAQGTARPPHSSATRLYPAADAGFQRKERTNAQHPVQLHKRAAPVRHSRRMHPAWFYFLLPVPPPRQDDVPRTTPSFAPCRPNSTASRPSLLLPGMQRPLLHRDTAWTTSAPTRPRRQLRCAGARGVGPHPETLVSRHRAHRQLPDGFEQHPRRRSSVALAAIDDNPGVGSASQPVDCHR